MIAWQRVEPTKVTKVGWRTVVSKTFIMPDGDQAIFDIEHEDNEKFVSIIAVTPENKIVVAKQYRPGPETILDELPGGAVDDGEELIEASRRELLEETGYSSDKFIYLGKAPQSAYSNNWGYGFIAYNCKKIQEQSLDRHEFIEVYEITIDQLLDNAKSGKLTDVHTVFMAYDRLMEVQKSEKFSAN